MAGGVHSFHLFGRLPEEEVWTDGGAEDTDDDGRSVGARREGRPDGAQRHFAPRDVNREQDSAVGQQGERQPFEVCNIAMVGNEHLPHERCEHEYSSHDVAIQAGHEFRDFSPAATSAATSGVFATNTSRKTVRSTNGGNASLMLAASPLPVTRPIRAHVA